MKRKNKQAEQTAQRKKHKENLKRRKEPLLSRQAPKRKEKQRILIVCEGKNTEPSYFKKFKLSSATIESIGGSGDPSSLVKKTSKLSKEDEYDQIWCVFDKDEWTAENFNDAIIKAEQHGFHIAYSNQAFEYWLILHFEDHQGGGMHRDDYCDKLNKYLNEFGLIFDVDSKKITEEIFEVLNAKIGKTGKTRQEVALKRAEKIHKNWSTTSPAQAESSTTVFKLVEEIEKYR